MSAVLAPTVGRLGYERAMRGELIDALRLDANYVRSRTRRRPGATGDGFRERDCGRIVLAIPPSGR